MEEIILCSATWYKELPTPAHRPKNIETGMVSCGFGHVHCMHAMIALTGKRSVESEVGKYVHGFLTSKNRFVDRIEGAEIALRRNQIKHLSFSKTKLYSEDLY